VGLGLGSATRVGTGTGTPVGTGTGAGTAHGTGTAVALGTATGRPVGDGTGAGVGSVFLHTPWVGTGAGVAVGITLGTAVGVALGATLGTGAGVAGRPAVLADDDSVPALPELRALDVPVAELPAAAGEHALHSRAMPAAPPAARTAKRVVACARLCVESMYSS
jgi:hypothetical protein